MTIVHVIILYLKPETRVERINHKKKPLVRQYQNVSKKEVSQPQILGTYQGFLGTV